ncbi:hypothetical protein NNJEOMEG_02282 [Fundidesulfovibrio magnetotacticus]|uniref:Uncharacterized protein n=1 Tax=Fundidesulfovibrio magnetotacticus TaxID=2730080 RepID=A0A6V8LXR4_9BACT|nr:hypothetical protein [Fundidesulfovibrio magnetotacticus]GFK94437.1 hypothetical protein NNJEOMEG_02282 [Fundidesulfovibrio magnetotacticus]
MDTAALAALILSAVLSLAGTLGAFILKHQVDTVRALQDRCAALEKAQAEQAQKAADTFLRREDCHRQTDAVLDRLKSIEDKLDRLVERGKP